MRTIIMVLAHGGMWGPTRCYPGSGTVYHIAPWSYNAILYKEHTLSIGKAPFHESADCKPLAQ